MCRKEVAGEEDEGVVKSGGSRNGGSISPLSIAFFTVFETGVDSVPARLKKCGGSGPTGQPSTDKLDQDCKPHKIPNEVSDWE
jgi:hypothetical protein